VWPIGRGAPRTREESQGDEATDIAEISTHFEGYWVFGAFFFSVAWFQVATAITLVALPAHRLFVIVAVVNLVVIGSWIWSRTAGLPIGPEAGGPETIGAADLLATVLEALLVAWALAVRIPAIGSRQASRAVGSVSTAIVWTGVVTMTAVVFFGTTAEMAHQLQVCLHLPDDLMRQDVHDAAVLQRAVVL
jgi:hypothetical protein